MISPAYSAFSRKLVSNFPRLSNRPLVLMRYAVLARYPGIAEPVSEEQHREAVALAEAVLQWVEERIQNA
jgi:hypothetical protein